MALLETMPKGLRWLLTAFLGLYVGAECGFGGWVATYVLLEVSLFVFGEEAEEEEEEEEERFHPQTTHPPIYTCLSKAHNPPTHLPTHPPTQLENHRFSFPCCFPRFYLLGFYHLWKGVCCPPGGLLTCFLVLKNTGG